MEVIHRSTGIYIHNHALGVLDMYVLPSPALYPSNIRETAATMAFSAFTLSKGVCSLTISKLYLPTCPLLTFDLALLHLLSTSTLTLVLVILSTTLSPNYHLSLSPSADGGKVGPEERDVFVMWDLALASPPGSPRLGPVRTGGGLGGGGRSYGAITNELAGVPGGVYPQPSNPYAIDDIVVTPTTTPKKRDKFAEGRLWIYIPLGMSSLAVLVAAAVVLGESQYGEPHKTCASDLSLSFIIVLNSVIIIVVASLSLTFVITLYVLSLLSPLSLTILTHS
jgi:hypothetical protein